DQANKTLNHEAREGLRCGWRTMPSKPLAYNADLRILISAGEASGEMYGAELILALRRAWLQNPAEFHSAGQSLRLPSGHALAAVPTKASNYSTALEFFGVGGDRMRAAGCDTVVDAKDLAVV